MHVMIATDGSLDADAAATIVAPLVSDGGQITLFTAVEVPRGFLSDIRGSVDQDTSQLRDVMVEYGGDKSAGAGPGPSSWVGDDALLARYVEEAVTRRTGDLISRLEAVGVEPEVVGVEGENAARAILEAVSERDVDVLCIGTHGLGRFEGLLGSTSTKLARRAECSVLLVR